MAIPKEQKRKAKRKAKQKQRISIQATTLVKAKANNFYQEALWYYREEDFDESLTNIKAALQYTPNADEVGLGKTIEALIVFKEYVHWGMVKSALILTPTPLVSQWRDELRDWK